MTEKIIKKNSSVDNLFCTTILSHTQNLGYK